MIPRHYPRHYQFMARRLDALQRRHLFRELTPLEHGTLPWITVNARSLLNLSSNNYLALADHPQVKEAAMAAVDAYGCGAGASRLVTGSHVLHSQFELEMAAFIGSEQALLFTSGYNANMGVIAALVGPRDVILGDALNHASIIDGCRLSGATYRIYAHCDTTALADLLAELERTHQQGTRLVVTDSIFSMDGDVAPLAEIAQLCQRYEALLVVDEAHATGCFGPDGRGLVAKLDLTQAVTASIYTLSKAFGCSGACVCCSALVKDYLINVARHFIFTTALPPASAAAGLAALDILRAQPYLPAQLQQRARFFRNGLQALGFETMTSETHIIPILVGDSAQALAMAQALREEGVYAVAIRPPTVPMGAARVRFSVMAAHTEDDLTFALNAIQRVGQRLNLLA